MTVPVPYPDDPLEPNRRLQRRFPVSPKAVRAVGRPWPSTTPSPRRRCRGQA